MSLQLSCIGLFNEKYITLTIGWRFNRDYLFLNSITNIQLEKKALGRQLKLFGMELETLEDRYGIWVTNMTDDLALSGFSMAQFYSTEAAMLVRCMIYNLLLVFKMTFLPEKERTQRISTLRFKYFIIPAHLGKDNRGRWLRLSVFSSKLKSKIQCILNDISTYSLPNSQLHCT
jgi:hypothetical protein